MSRARFELRADLPVAFGKLSRAKGVRETLPTRRIHLAAAELHVHDRAGFIYVSEADVFALEAEDVEASSRSRSGRVNDDA